MYLCMELLGEYIERTTTRCHSRCSQLSRMTSDQQGSYLRKRTEDHYVNMTSSRGPPSQPPCGRRGLCAKLPNLWNTFPVEMFA